MYEGELKCILTIDWAPCSNHNEIEMLWAVKLMGDVTDEPGRSDHVIMFVDMNL